MQRHGGLGEGLVSCINKLPLRRRAHQLFPFSQTPAKPKLASSLPAHSCRRLAPFAALGVGHAKCNVFRGGFHFHLDGTVSRQLDVIVTTDTASADPRSTSATFK